MKDDCLYLNDVECPYASGHEICEGCDTYEKDTRRHPLDDSHQADYLRDMEQEDETRR